MNSRLLSAALLPFALVSTASVRAQATLPKDIFTPPASAAVATAPAETIEFAGVTTIGKKTDVVIVDKAAKKSRTIPVGETVDGIQVLRYDADKDQVVVKISGVQKTLPLRKGSGPVNAPAAVAVTHTGFNVPSPAATPTPAPSALVNAPGSPVFGSVAAPAPVPQPPPAQPTGPATPETIAKAETEARMLVSDLLEIGMAQRKAYEEAQRRAQENPNNPAPPALPAQPASQPPSK